VLSKRLARLSENSPLSWEVYGPIKIYVIGEGEGEGDDDGEVLTVQTSKLVKAR